MSMKPASTEPCWEIVDPDGQRPDGWESYPHYSTAAEAKVAADIHNDEREADRETPEEWAATNAWRKVQGYPQLPYPEPDPEPYWRPGQPISDVCVNIFCDGCDEKVDFSGEGWTHYDPTELPDWPDGDMFELNGRHWHNDCLPDSICRWSEDEDGVHAYADGECEVCGHDEPHIAADPVDAPLLSGVPGVL